MTVLVAVVLVATTLAVMGVIININNIELTLTGWTNRIDLLTSLVTDFINITIDIHVCFILKFDCKSCLLSYSMCTAMTIVQCLTLEAIKYTQMGVYFLIQIYFGLI